MNLIDIRNVTKQYAHHLALDDISFSIPKGVVFGLLGPNGAGKTTLIRILNQITAPDQGEILFDGRPIRRSDIHRIGYLPEERGLYKKMRVGEQALYLARLKGVSKNEAEYRLRTWFRKFEIDSWWNRNVEELSKGMQQKIQFITTMIHEPEFLIFDEPFSGFDPINANLLKEEILELKKKGATIILSTHNMASVEEICDQIALINKAHKILEGKLSDIKEKFKHHLFEIEIALHNAIALTDFPNEMTLVSRSEKADNTLLTLKLKEGFSSNILLNFMMKKGTIHSFKEILPSMNDIFIDQVKHYDTV
jgi:ABC-2 type transport system ATP-binding protein